jgi:hypothetical protein
MRFFKAKPFHQRFGLADCGSRHDRSCDVGALQAIKNASAFLSASGEPFLIFSSTGETKDGPSAYLPGLGNGTRPAHVVGSASLVALAIGVCFLKVP